MTLAEGVTVGAWRELVVVEDLTRTQIVQYAGASADFNPLHTDDRYAREVAGYPGVFAHGMLTMGMTGRLLTDWFGGARLVEYGARFLAQVWPGDRLTARGEVTGLVDDAGRTCAEIMVTTTNQDGVLVLSGSALVALEPGS